MTSKRIMAELSAWLIRHESRQQRLAYMVLDADKRKKLIKDLRSGTVFTPSALAVDLMKGMYETGDALFEILQNTEYRMVV